MNWADTDEPPWTIHLPSSVRLSVCGLGTCSETKPVLRSVLSFTVCSCVVSQSTRHECQAYLSPLWHSHWQNPAADLAVHSSPHTGTWHWTIKASTEFVKLAWQTETLLLSWNCLLSQQQSCWSVSYFCIHLDSDELAKVAGRVAESNPRQEGWESYPANCTWCARSISVRNASQYFACLHSICTAQRWLFLTVWCSFIPACCGEISPNSSLCHNWKSLLFVYFLKWILMNNKSLQHLDSIGYAFKKIEQFFF